MKNITLLLVFLLLSSISYAQAIKKGIVYNGNNAVEDVIVQNKTTQDRTATNGAGIFKLALNIKDTLQVIYLNKVVYSEKIERKDLDKEWIEINIESATERLDEVYLENRTDINAVSLGISKPGIIQPTKNERRLRTAGDFKPIHLLGLLAGSLQVDPILNAINGKTKKLKKLIAYDNVTADLVYLEENYKTYVMKEFNLDEPKAISLLVFVSEQEKVRSLILEENDGAIKIFLIDSYSIFKSYGN